MTKHFLFAGTSEGRRLYEALARAQISTVVFVATRLGAQQLRPSPSMEVRVGRLDAKAMQAAMEEDRPSCVWDATHPYAEEVSAAIQEATKASKLLYRRVLRPALPLGQARGFSSMEAMLAYLEGKEGRIFSGLGLKAAQALSGLSHFHERVFLRILPFSEGLAHCEALGYQSRQIMAMQGPFSDALNRALFSAIKPKFLLTKASGEAGGFEEKCKAARASQMEVLVLLPPAEPEGVTLEQALAMLSALRKEGP